MRTIKKILPVILILLHVSVFAQVKQNRLSSNTTNNVGGNTDDKSYLPNFTPPSPESLSITQYGKNEANEFKGRVNLNIPIHTLVSGKITIPISLNYSGAGVKVNDFSTWTGINWTLSSGGVINRTVNSYADEINPTQRVYINEAHMLANATNTCAPDSQFYFNLCQSSQVYDTEVDLFRYSFNGYSGSFYLDENFQPVSLENEQEVKIEIVGSYTDNARNLRENKKFIITTPDGVKYYFGGDETEQSSPYSGNRHSASLANTSFYLYKIEHPVYGTVVYEYKTYALANLVNNHVDTIKMEYEGFDFSGLPAPVRTSSQTLFNNLKYLSKIKSLDTTEEIIFNTTDINNPLVGARCVLNSIEVKKENTLIKKVDLSYYARNIATPGVNNFETAPRFFLEKVEINKDMDISGTKHDIYKMEYDHAIDLPNRLSDSQDILGYYNGAPIHQSLVPYNSGFGPMNSSFGVRTPNFSKAEKGSLKKIFYPTKGHSTFEYESIPAKEKVYTTFFGATCRDTIACNNPVLLPGNDIPTSLENSTYINFPTVIEDQNITITLRAGAYEDDNGYVEISQNKTAKVQLKIIDLTDATKSQTFSQTQGQTLPSVGYRAFRFLKGHNYRFEFGTFYDLGRTSNFGGSFSFKLFTGYRLIDGFGVRLKKQQDFISNDESKATNIVSYKYGGLSPSVNTLVADLTIQPNYSLTFDEATNVFNQNSGGDPMVDNQAGMTLNLYSDPFMHADAIESYPVVGISYGGDNFENGGVEKYFNFINNVKINKLELLNDGCWLTPITNVMTCGLPSTINTSITIVRNFASSPEVTDMGLFNGKLLHQRFYKKDNGILYKQKEITYDYVDFEAPITKAVNFVGRELFGYELPNWCNGVPKYPLSGCYMGYYYINSYNVKLASTVTKEFIDPVPISLYYSHDLNFNNDLDQTSEDNLAAENASYRKITTTQNFEYGSLKGLPTKITTSTSDNNINSVVENTYANQASTLGLQVSAYNKLVAINNIANPIQVSQFKNTDLLSKQRTLYKQSTTNADLVLPETIQIAKGSQTLEDRVVFEEYDAKGNPTLVSYIGGTKTKYLYNANNQVYLKIENFTGTLDPNTNPISGDPCAFMSQYPNAMVTIFTYDPVTNLLLQTMDSNCRKTTYVYDALSHLKQIKDHNGNIVKEFDNNYRPQ